MRCCSGWTGSAKRCTRSTAGSTRASICYGSRASSARSTSRCRRSRTLRSASRVRPCGGAAPASELVDPAGLGREVELARDVLAERRQRPDTERLAADVHRAAAVDAQAPDDSRAVVTEEVASGRRRYGPAAIDVPTGYGAGTAVVVVDVNRRDELSRSERRVRIARAALEGLPAVVRERLDLGLRPVVDLLPVSLSDVRDVEVAVRTIEREAPWIAEPERDHLPRRASAKRIDAQQLAQPLTRSLRAVARITGRAAVAHADVEAAVAVELQLSPVVVRVRLAHEEELPRSRLHAATSPRTELDYSRVPSPVRVVDVEPVVTPIVRVEGNREQTLLAAAQHAIADVEEGAAQPPVDEVSDHAALFDGVQASGLRRGRSDRRQRREAARERPDRQLLLRLRSRNDQRGCGGEERPDHLNSNYRPAAPSVRLLSGVLATS